MKYVIFSDFDGTITTEDTGTFLFDLGMGYTKRKELDKQILAGTLTFRHAVTNMWNSVSMPLDQAFEILNHIEFDQHFGAFYQWIQQNEIDFTVLSGGLDILIEHFFVKHGHKLPKIQANKVKIHKDRWEIIYLDDSEYGHDKGVLLRDLKIKKCEKISVFIGDGVSDLSAAFAADMVFAKKDKDLERYCIMKGIKYYPWSDFSEIHAVLLSSE